MDDGLMRDHVYTMSSTGELRSYMDGTVSATINWHSLS